MAKTYDGTKANISSLKIITSLLLTTVHLPPRRRCGKSIPFKLPGCEKVRCRGRSGCTSHHICVDVLDELLRAYIRKVMDNPAAMLEKLNAEMSHETDDIAETEQSADHLAEILEQLQEELKAMKRQRIRKIMKKPEQEAALEELYDELEAELIKKIEGLNHQIDMLSDKRNTIILVNRSAKTTMDVFLDVLEKKALERNDLELIIDRIYVYQDHLDMKLKPDIDTLLKCGLGGLAANFKSGIGDISLTRIVQKATKQKDKVFDVNVIREGKPSRYFTGFFFPFML